MRSTHPHFPRVDNRDTLNISSIFDLPDGFGAGRKLTLYSTHTIFPRRLGRKLRHSNQRNDLLSHLSFLAKSRCPLFKLVTFLVRFFAPLEITNVAKAARSIPRVVLTNVMQMRSGCSTGDMELVEGMGVWLYANWDIGVELRGGLGVNNLLVDGLKWGK